MNILLNISHTQTGTGFNSWLFVYEATHTPTEAASDHHCFISCTWCEGFYQEVNRLWDVVVFVAARQNQSVLIWHVCCHQESSGNKCAAVQLWLLTQQEVSYNQTRWWCHQYKMRGNDITVIFNIKTNFSLQHEFTPVWVGMINIKLSRLIYHVSLNTWRRVSGWIHMSHVHMLHVTHEHVT